MLYVGVDLHRTVSQVAVVDERGELMLNRRVPSDRDELLRVFGEAPRGGVRGHLWVGVVRRSPGGRRDSRAHGASASQQGDLQCSSQERRRRCQDPCPPASYRPPARVLDRSASGQGGPSAGSHAHRAGPHPSRLKNQVHAILADYGLHPAGSDVFAGSTLAELGRQLPVLSRQRLEANLRLIDDIDREVDGADTQIHKLFARDAGVRRLMPIPGIGIITAAIVVAEVGDITRFPSARHFCFWCGLTSTEHSSADHTRRGHISKQGSRWLPWVLVEAACHPYRNRELAAVQGSVASPRGDKIARIALARRLATLSFYALRNPRGCRAFPIR